MIKFYLRAIRVEYVASNQMWDDHLKAHGGGYRWQNATEDQRIPYRTKVWEQLYGGKR